MGGTTQKRWGHLALFVRQANNVSSAWFSPVRLIIVAVLFGVGGCQNGFRDSKQSWLLTKNDVAAYVTQALEGSNPDERRRAINRLAQTRHVSDRTVLEALALVARTDSSQSVRAAAVFALSKSTAPIACNTYLMILADDAEQATGNPPNALVRVAAVHGLLGCAKTTALPSEFEEKIIETGIRLLHSDRSRNVRLATTQLLGYFAREDVLDELVNALEQRDFGVCYGAERSLMRLTGRSFDHDPQAWRSFLAGTDDPYANRGELDDQLEPRKRRRFGWLKRQG